jgi:hypothetical protein
MATGRPRQSELQARSPKNWWYVKGTLNKKDTARRQGLDRAAEIVMPQLPVEIRDMSPLEALLLCMRWSVAMKDRNGILAAAAAAVPYVHPRLASADLRIRDEHAGKSDEQLQAEIAELERRIAAV